MLDSIKQFVLVILAMFLAHPVGEWAFHAMRGPDGLDGVPLVLADAAFAMLARSLMAAVWFAFLALIVGLFSHRYTGALAYGLMWMLVAKDAAPIGDVLRLVDELGRSFTGTYVWFAAEGLLWTLPAVVLAWLLALLTPNRYEDEAGPIDPVSLRGLAVATVGSLVLCWLFVPTELKGQALGGVALGSALAVMGTRMAMPTANGTVLFLIPAVLAFVGPLSGAVVVGSDAMESLAAGELWALARPLPLDFMAAGVFGVALGIGMARSFGHEEEPKPAPRERGPGGDGAGVPVTTVPTAPAAAAATAKDAAGA